MSTFVFVSLVVVLLFVKNWIDKSRRKPVGVPGPSYKIPWVGNFYDIRCADTGSKFAEWTKQYGDILCYYMLGQYKILVTDPADVKHVLLNNHLFDKNLVQYRIMTSILGNGLVTEQNEELHKYHRSIVSPAFANSHLRGLVPIFQQKGKILVEDWQKQAGTRKLVDIKDDIAKATSDIIGEAAFNYKLHAQRNNSPCSIYNIYAHIVGNGMNIYDMIPSINILNKEVNHIIDYKAETRQPKSQPETKEESQEYKRLEKRDLLDILMDCTNEEGAMLTKEELAGQAKTFLLAGYETSSVCILWTLHLLSRYLNIQQKLAEEILCVIGKDKNPTAEDIDKMPYMLKVVQESLRMRPPIPIVARQTSQDVVLKGYHIPKGTQVVVSIYHQHHNPKLWKDPEIFNPERWNDGESETISKLGAYIPFILGARNCIGNRFALLEIRVILAMILQKLSFSPIPGLPEPGRRARISMTPTRPIQLYFEHRN